jgi:hypothetical protein
MLNKRKKKWLIVIAVVILLAVVISLPPVWSRVVYHTRVAYTAIKYWIKPPSEAVFVPSTEKESVAATNTAAASNSQSTKEAALNQTQSTLEPTFTPAFSPVPLPPSVLLKGITCEAQLWNNCGPATLSMYLSFYNWGKSQIAVATELKPNERDLKIPNSGHSGVMAETHKQSKLS